MIKKMLLLELILVCLSRTRLKKGIEFNLTIGQKKLYLANSADIFSAKNCEQNISNCHINLIDCFEPFKFKHYNCSEFRYESNGIFVLGVGFFSSDKFRLFN